MNKIDWKKVLLVLVQYVLPLLLSTGAVVQSVKTDGKVTGFLAAQK